MRALEPASARGRVSFSTTPSTPHRLTRAESPSNLIQPLRRFTRQSVVDAHSDHKRVHLDHEPGHPVAEAVVAEGQAHPDTDHTDHQHSSQSHSSDKTIPFTAEEEAENFRQALAAGHQAERINVATAKQFDQQAEVINAAIMKQLPAHLDNVVGAAVAKQLPAYLTQDLLTATVDALVSSQLRTVLQATLFKAIDAAVARQLPMYFTEGRHYDAVDASVSHQLRPLLRVLLPEAMEALFKPPSPASPALSSDSNGDWYLNLPPLSPFGELLVPHLRSHLAFQSDLDAQKTLVRFEKLARKTLHELEKSAADDRMRAQLDFEDDIANLKDEALLMKKDLVDNMWRDGQKLLEGARGACARFGEHIDHHLDQISTEIDDRMGGAGLRKMVEREVRRQLSEGRQSAAWKRKGRLKRKRGERGGGEKLGRRRAEVEEWEDI